VFVKILENNLARMDGLKTYSERTQVLCEGIFSKFGHTYPFVFNGRHLKLRQSD
jgi:hypothetical protein